MRHLENVNSLAKIKYPKIKIFKNQNFQNYYIIQACKNKCIAEKSNQAKNGKLGETKVLITN